MNIKEMAQTVDRLRTLADTKKCPELREIAKAVHLLWMESVVTERILKGFQDSANEELNKKLMEVPQ